MKTFRIKFIGIIVLFGLTACGSSAPNLSKQAELQDRETLLTTLNSITGKYQGVIQNSPEGNEDFPVEIDLYVIEEPNGVNEAGEQKFRPSLRGDYRRLDFPLDGTSNKNLVGRYYQENNTLTLFSAVSTTQTSAGSAANYISITATIEQNEIKGQARNQLGIMGDLVLTKK